jgi:hypothetical protein
MSDWKAISTAPKDGRKLLLFAHLKSDPEMTFHPVIGHWNDAVQAWKVTPEQLNAIEELMPSLWRELPHLPTKFEDT